MVSARVVTLHEPLDRKALAMALDWQNLDFSYRATNAHLRYTWKQGQWDAGVVVREPMINLHIASTALHYGQAAFEGLKAFTLKDGSVAVFRVDENARRLQSSARRLCMVEVPTSLFEAAVLRAVRENREFVPPYGTGGSLYIRPLLIGSGARIGVQPADEYTFIILVVPVGNYYKGGLNPVSAMVFDDFDRAAPNGTGGVKVGGNYAADLMPSKQAKEQHCQVTLYLDAKEHRWVDEFATSNFIAISADKREYLTPESSSALPSITNKSLMTLAADIGLKVTRRPIAWDEIASFSEVAACGTAVVITPVHKIHRGEQVITVGPAKGCGPVLQRLYDMVRAIQVGEAPDRHDWLRKV
jgi:branched-chain amino acid aminotransferase